MLTVGLTGGIGSGKSTVARQFAQLGINIIDTDDIAHQLTATDTPYYHRIVNHFGPVILNEDRSLNRKALGRIVFQEAQQKLWLEHCLHPPILEVVRQEVEKSQSPYCIVVIPLLVEQQLGNRVDRILVIDTPPEYQVKRTMARDNLNAQQVTHIINSQCTREQRLNMADDVISNHTDLATLQQQVQNLHQDYLQLCQQ